MFAHIGAGKKEIITVHIESRSDERYRSLPKNIHSILLLTVGIHRSPGVTVPARQTRSTESIGRVAGGHTVTQTTPRKHFDSCTIEHIKI